MESVALWNFAGLGLFLQFVVCFFLRFILSIQGTAKGGQLKRNLKCVGSFANEIFQRFFHFLKFQSFWDSLAFIHTFCPSHWSMRRKPKRWPIIGHFCRPLRILCYAHLNTSGLGLLTELAGKKKWMRKGGKFLWNFSPYFKVQISKKCWGCKFWIVVGDINFWVPAWSGWRSGGRLICGTRSCCINKSFNASHVLAIRVVKKIQPQLITRCKQATRGLRGLRKPSHLPATPRDVVIVWPAIQFLGDKISVYCHIEPMWEKRSTWGKLR